MEPANLLCSGLMDQVLFQKIIADAALTGRQSGLLNVLNNRPPTDKYPEGFYLKGFACESLDRKSGFYLALTITVLPYP